MEKPKLHLGILLGKPDNDPEEEGNEPSSKGEYAPSVGSANGTGSGPACTNALGPAVRTKFRI